MALRKKRLSAIRSRRQSGSSESQDLSLYDKVLLKVFHQHYNQGAEYLKFSKDELAEACEQYGVTIKNIPDIIYTYRTRRVLPDDIRKTGHWAIEPAGRGFYAFRLLQNSPHFNIPFYDYAPIDIHNAIPELVEKLLRYDEQSLLTRVLYNRLIDIFTGLTCFHIQNHYRSFVEGMGEVELDALYVGIDKTGKLYILPIEAKSQAENDMIGRIQISQMAKLVRQDFADLDRRILAIKYLKDGTIVIIEFDDQVEPDDFKIVSVSRFRLIRQEQLRSR